MPNHFGAHRFDPIPEGGDPSFPRPCQVQGCTTVREGRGTDEARLNTTKCHAAETGEGYWTCDVVGGCRGCRFLARDAEDFSVLAEWSEDAVAASIADAQALFTAVAAVEVDTERETIIPSSKAIGLPVFDALVRGLLG